MTPPALLFSLPGFRIEGTDLIGTTVIVEASSLQAVAPCPRCGSCSRWVHSSYLRMPRDLPWSAYTVRLKLHVPRFLCGNRQCPQRTFAERLPNVLPVHAQRTVRFTQALQVLGFSCGGAAGSRVARQLRFPTSRDTLLRIVRSTPLPVLDTPRVLGIDDVALQKGRIYATIFVDLERHRPVDLVPERTSEMLARWLRAHPGIQIIARDRSNEYARGATTGAPTALQVADRWHVLRNLRDVLERVVTRRRAQLRALPGLLPVATNFPLPMAQPRRLRPVTESERLRQQESRSRRYQRYVVVHELLAQGLSHRRIARLLGMSRVTVSAFARVTHVPERRVRPPSPSQLEPYIGYLQQRWAEGCHNASQLWRELQAHGYPLGRRHVMRWAQQQRDIPAPTTPKMYRDQVGQKLVAQQSGGAEALRPLQMVSEPGQLMWLLLRRRDDLSAKDQAILDHIVQDPHIHEAYALTQWFRELLQERDSAAVSRWLQACATSRLVDFRSFATSLMRERSAVVAAVHEPWSTGQVEGQNTRVKLIKRQMYGRANFDLLRRRVLYHDDG